MRGVAVLMSAFAAWTVVTGIVPYRSMSLPRVELKTVAASTLVGGGVGLTSFVTFSIPVLAVSLGVLSASVPVSRASAARLSEADRIVKAWPDVLLRIRSSLSAGATIADASIEAMEAAGPPFRSVAKATRREVILGKGFAAAMESARQEFGDEVSDRVFVTLGTAAETGGQRVGEIVTTLARSVAGEVRLRAAHDASMAEQRLTANVALVAPWVLLMLAVATNPQAQGAFLTAQGGLVIAGGFVATTAGWLLAMQTAKLNKGPRVFQ